MFSGLLYCADCGEKLYYSVTNNYKREQAYFFCSAYRKNSEVCSAHYIREKVVEENVLENMRRVFRYVQAYEKEFAKQQMKCYGEEKQKELSEKRRELTKAEKRIKDIDLLIQKIYEDNAMGKLSDERFATMSMAYEEEQKTLSTVKPLSLCRNSDSTAADLPKAELSVCFRDFSTVPIVEKSCITA